MKSAKKEYQKGKRLKVVYPKFDDKHEYRKPILCRARDIGKVIYGKWIIGGEQANGLTGEVDADDTEKFYTAYKLVGGAEIICNFELEDRNIPCTIFVRFTDVAVCRSPQEQEVERLYYVDAAMNSYHPVCGEPEINATDNGIIYIKMPSGVESKQTDDAAEEKFTLFPQLQKDDIVRYVSRLSGVEIIDVATYEHLDDYFYSIGEVVAIYRFDGRDFKCIWESEEYKLCKWNEALANAAESARRAGVSLKEVTAAFERLIKEKSKKGEQ